MKKKQERRGQEEGGGDQSNLEDITRTEQSDRMTLLLFSDKTSNSIDSFENNEEEDKDEEKNTGNADEEEPAPSPPHRLYVLQQVDDQDDIESSYHLSQQQVENEKELKVSPPNEKEDEAEVQTDTLIATPSPPPSQPLQQQLEIPSILYCPITKQLLRDPVVVPDGTTFERQAIIERDDDGTNDDSDKTTTKLYPNRALQAIIAEELILLDTKSSPEMMIQQQQTNHHFHHPRHKKSSASLLSDIYYCPITFELIHDPVIDPEGNTYERQAIYKWIRRHHTSPITRTPLAIKDVYENHAWKRWMEYQKSKSDETIHPCIEQWKLEKPPTILRLAHHDDGDYNDGTTFSYERRNHRLPLSNQPASPQQHPQEPPPPPPEPGQNHPSSSFILDELRQQHQIIRTILGDEIRQQPQPQLGRNEARRRWMFLFVICVVLLIVWVSLHSLIVALIIFLALAMYIYFIPPPVPPPE